MLNKLLNLMHACQQFDDIWQQQAAACPYLCSAHGPDSPLVACSFSSLLQSQCYCCGKALLLRQQQRQRCLAQMAHAAVLQVRAAARSGGPQGCGSAKGRRPG